jgi:hypothetical protein
MNLSESIFKDQSTKTGCNRLFGLAKAQSAAKKLSTKQVCRLRLTPTKKTPVFPSS